MTESEVILKLKDPKFFIERFFWIQDKNKKTIPLVFNYPQNKFWPVFQTWMDWLIVKSRKEGFSTLIEAVWLHACMFFENEKAVTMAQNQDEMKVHRDRIDFFLKTMGTKDIRWEVTIDDENQREISFPATNSRYWVGAAGSGSFGRSRDITRFHGTEVAHYADQSVLTGVLNACIPNAPKVLETTANGVGDVVHDLWTAADDPKSGTSWKQFFAAWFEDPTNRLEPKSHMFLNGIEQKMKIDYNLDDSQVNWYRQKLGEQTDKQKMKQEYPCNPREAFLSSGRHFLNLEILDEYASKASKPNWTGTLRDDGHTVTFSPNAEGELQIWKMPRDPEMFLIGADVAEGVSGGAWSVAKVYSRSSWECVAQWRGRIDPGDFGRIMVTMGYFWNNAVLCPELNNHGHATIEAIKAEAYPHILNTKILWPEGSMEKYGFPTDDRTRPLIFSALSNAIDQRTFIEHDIVTLKEMQKLVKDERGKVIVESGFMDTTIASAIALYCLKFMTVDETYRDHDERRSPVRVSSLTSKPSGRSRAGYR